MILNMMGWFLFGLAIAGGLVLNFAGLFGNWVIFGAMLGAWVFTRFRHFGLWSLAGLLALALLGEALELAAASYGAGRFGGSRGAKIAAVAGCILGAIVGTPWFPVVGTLLGACLGAFAAAGGYEYFVERRQPYAAFRVGAGAATGKVAGMIAKILVGILMLFVAAMTY